jgi:hypothetical protein
MSTMADTLVLSLCLLMICSCMTVQARVLLQVGGLVLLAHRRKQGVQSSVEKEIQPPPSPPPPPPALPFRPKTLT